MIARSDAEVETLHARITDAIRVVPPGWSPLDYEEEPDGTVIVTLRHVGAVRARVTIPTVPPDPLHPWRVRVYWGFDAPGFPWGCAQAVDVEVKADALALFAACSWGVAAICDASPTEAALAMLWPDRAALDRVALALRGG